MIIYVSSATKRWLENGIKSLSLIIFKWDLYIKDGPNIVIHCNKMEYKKRNFLLKYFDSKATLISRKLAFLSGFYIRLSQFQRRTPTVSLGIRESGRRFPDIAHAINI